MHVRWKHRKNRKNKKKQQIKKTKIVQSPTRGIRKVNTLLDEIYLQMCRDIEELNHENSS